MPAVSTVSAEDTPQALLCRACLLMNAFRRQPAAQLAADLCQCLYHLANHPQANADLRLAARSELASWTASPAEPNPRQQPGRKG